MQRRQAPCAQPVPGSPHPGRAWDPLAAGGACTCPPGHPPAWEAGSLGTEGLACGAQPLRCCGGGKGGRAGPLGGGEARPGGGERYSVAGVGVGATTPARISRDEAGALLSRCAGAREQVRAGLAGLQDSAPCLTLPVSSCGLDRGQGTGVGWGA